MSHRKTAFLRRLFGHREQAPEHRSDAATNRKAQQAVSDITANVRGGPDADVHYPAAASAIADEEAGALGPNPVTQPRPRSQP